MPGVREPQHEVQLTLQTLSDLTRAMLDAFHSCERDRFVQLDRELEATVGRKERMINARSETAEFSKHRSLFAHARIGRLGHTRGRPLKEIAISFAKTSLRSMSRLVVASEAGYGEYWRGATSDNSCLFRFGTP
jgi:predicted ATPase